MLRAIFIVTLAALTFSPCLAGEEAAAEQTVVRVGRSGDVDFQGQDGRVLQAAADYVAGLGGGTVQIGPGRYLMRDTLRVGPNVRIVGVPGETVLVSCDMHQSQLASSGGTTELQISVADPDGFRIGDGIMVQDDTSMYGFACTQATITARLDENTFRISRPLSRDYSPARNARVSSGFPVVGLYGADHAELEGLTIDGNAENMVYLTGCRGGGIYLLESDEVSIRNCTVRNYHGDAISFQTTRNVLIEDCVCESNVGVGLHPGCGTENAVVRRTRCANNGGDGLFLCMRVKHCRFEDLELTGNQRHGISIGNKDSDNEFTGNRVLANAKSGIFFRENPASGGGHRNVFVNNRILDNGDCIRIEGEHHGLVFRGNAIGYSNLPESEQPAIHAGAGARELKLSENELLHVTAP